jgi:outer membrane lipoprotein-sorting protein
VVNIRLKVSRIIVIAVSILAAGCAVSRKTVVAPITSQPALIATKQELVDRYNRAASAVQTITAAVRMSPTAGSALSGVIENYHEVNGYVLAARPASIRVIGQAPVVAKDIFDMVSDGQTFHIFIPSKNEFIEGPADLRRTAKRPIENLRPQHLFDALVWPVIKPDTPVLLEEFDALPARYYVLTIAANEPQGWELKRKVWFDRTSLQIARIQIYDAQGAVVSDIQTRNWQPSGETEYPRDVRIDRPVDEYSLDIAITQLTLNQTISADRFHLAQPAGTTLVHLSEETQP